MKVFLMHRDQDLDVQRELPPNTEPLIQDLELTTLFNAMARGDQFLFEIAKRVMLSGLTEPDTIIYRQHVLADCQRQPAVIKEIYDLAVATIEGERRGFYFLFRDSPDSILTRSVQVLQFFAQMLKKLRIIADEHAGGFRSDGFTRFFETVSKELDDDYLQLIEDHLKELNPRRGVLISAQLGRGNKGSRYVLRRRRNHTWMERLTTGTRSGYSFQIADRDQNGFKALSELRGKGLNTVANVLAQSTDHILSFFKMLKVELAFYIGCLNLHEQLIGKASPTCFPTPIPVGKPVFFARGLYDPSLALTVDATVVGNDVTGDGKLLFLITGANQGGKSTFLRGVGLAQLMMQCGMFVPAESFHANVSSGVFTHHKREEHATMESGKLDEELSRMSDLADQMTPDSILLCNESFASTNEREGSEIARQIVHALVDAGVKVFFVTHLFDLANRLYREGTPTTLLLRAERRADARRTFKLHEGEPLPTSFGEDSYRRIFGTSLESAAVSLSDRAG